MEDKEALLPIDIREYIQFVETLQERGLVGPPVYASLLKELGNTRSASRKKMKTLPTDSEEYMQLNTTQGSCKLLMVSAYGVSGYGGTRFFNVEFFNSVSGMGQYLILSTFDIARSMGYEIVYSDTDSVFMYPKEEVDTFRLTLDFDGIAKEINTNIHNYCKLRFGVNDKTYVLNLDAEKIYSKCLFTSSKKKYRGQKIWEDGKYVNETQLVGFEAKRGDASEIVKRVQLKVQEVLMESGDLEKVTEYMNSVIEEVYAGKCDKELVLAKAINKARLSDYAVEAPHVKAAKILEQTVGFRSGDTVRYIVTDIGADGKPSIVPIDPAHPDVLPKIAQQGYDYYMEKVVDMVERLIGQPLKGLIKGRHYSQHSIFDFGD